MKRSMFGWRGVRGALSLLVAAATVLGGSQALGQDLTAKEMMDGLDDAIKKRGNDAAAVGILDLLTEAYPNYEEADQKKVVKAVEKCLGRSREDGDSKLYVAALSTLGLMGEGGLKAATKALKNKNVKKRPDAMAAAVRSIGVHKDDKSVKTLLGFLVYKEPVVVAATAETLGDNYTEKPEKDRKVIVKELVKNYANYASQVVANPREPIWRERLGVVEGSMLRALAALTGVEHGDSVAWQKWYNDNKKKRWGELKKDEG